MENNEEIKQNEEENYTELTLGKSDEQEDEHVDMVGEMDAESKEAESTDEEIIDDEPPIDLSTIELDDDGIPVLTNEDLKQLT